MKQWIRWILTNLVFYIIFYLGFFENMPGAKNVVIFYIWFMSTIVFFAIQNDEFFKKYQKTIRTLLGIYFDIGMISILVWFGYFFTAIIASFPTLISLGLYVGIFEKKIRNTI